MKEYNIIFHDMIEVARFVAYLEKNGVHGTLTCNGSVSDARSLLGILANDFIGRAVRFTITSVWNPEEETFMIPDINAQQV